MPTFVDLHCHSTASDGTLPPREVVRLAKRSNLSALALTDHDTIAGCADAADEAKKLGIDFLPGIEISAEFPHPATMHILGYGIDPAHPTLKNLTATLLSGRDNRNPQIIAKLNDLGVSITMEEVENEALGAQKAKPDAPRKPIGRPHIAAVLVRKGYVSSAQQAFDKYLAQGAPAYFDKERLSPKQAIESIHAAGGVAVLAHPFQLRTTNDAQLEQIIKNLADLGLDGLEVLHSDHDESWINKISALADRYHLLKTGGSDFHGHNKKDIQLGLARTRRIPREYFDALTTRIAHK
jgi:3',5'-nucleoside bisphosphate phosphatase